MIKKYEYIIIGLIVFLISLNETTLASQFKIVQSNNGEFVVVVDHQFHIDYGLQYPLTYEFSVSDGYDSLKVFKKGYFSDQWEIIPIKNQIDFFNGEESVRLDTNNNKAYLSVSLFSNSDSLFIRIVDQLNIPVQAEYLGISEYYDNRKAVVTATIDDIAYWFNPHFINGAVQFQNRKIWVNLGIISDACDENNTWQDVQDLLDDGYAEASAHSQTHPYIPYGANLEYEVSGCFSSIKNNLDLPPLYKSGETEYVYSWLCPYGQHDNQVDSLLGVDKILVNRLYEPPYFYGFADWDSTFGLFEPLLVSREMGLTDWPSYATTNLDTLNSQFDDAYALNGIYHLVMHPQTVDWNGNYAQQHLDYISMRNDVWYASLGHLYLYRLMYLNQPEVVVSVDENQIAGTTPKEYQLFQNYPNPFNPSTKISWQAPASGWQSLKVYDVLGNEVTTLVNEYRAAGSYEIEFNPTSSIKHPASGIYFYRLQAGSFFETKKMLLIK
jgi:hypothetical protein